jgi:protease I
MNDLRNVKIAVLTLEGVEKAEITEPVKAFRDAGAEVTVISKERKPVRTFVHHDPADTYPVDATFDERTPDEFDALFLPGGALNADALRMIPQARNFVTSFARAGKPIAAICHAPWLLASANLLKGRALTSFFTIQDDLRNAGAAWRDEAVVQDGNLITARMPDDIPAFNPAVIALFAQAARAGAPA